MMQRSISIYWCNAAQPLVGNDLYKSHKAFNGDIEYQINVSNIPLENFGREFFMLEPELLNNIARS
jgi:hypothetical protein